MSGHRFSRRYFFYGSLLAGTIPAGGFGATPSLKAAGYKSPNEKLNIAAIGAGGRAASDIAGVASENLVAFCDVDEKRAADVYKKYPNAPKYKDFRQMLDKERDIDAVTIAIPDHMHGTAAMWAMQRGKHVYCEKPLTHTVWEARMLTEAAKKYGVATQMGNQGYSNEGARIASEILWSGEIGDVTEVHAWTDRPIWPQGVTTIPQPDAVPATLDWDNWLGVAANRPYTSGGSDYARDQKTNFGFYAPFNWRGFFDFGCGAIGDMALHLLGAVNMSLRLTTPTSVEVIHQEGKSDIMFPKKSVTRFDFPARGSMPPVKIFWHDAAKQAAFRPEGIPPAERIIGGLWSLPMPTTPPAPPALDAKPVDLATAENNGVVFLGTKGIMTTDTYAGSVRLLPASRMEDYRPPAQLLTRSPGHHRDWIRACKGGDPACSNFGVSGPFTEWLLTGAVALHFEGKLDWDGSKMQFTNNKAANELLKPVVPQGLGMARVKLHWPILVALVCSIQAFGGAPALTGAPAAETLHGTVEARDKGAITIVTHDGGKTRRITLTADNDGDKVLRDKHLAKLDVAVHGHFTGRTRFELDPFFDKPIHAMKNGKELLVTYWCGNCGIRYYLPGKCICCGGDTTLDLHEEETVAVK